MALSNDQRSQYMLEIIWMEKRIESLAKQLHKKPSKQKEIDDLRRQIKHTQYQIALAV